MDVSSPGIVSQVIMTIIITGAIFVIYMTVETLYRAYISFGAARVDIYPFSGNINKTFKQNPANPSNVLLPLSENQLTGIEFSYSTFLYISDNNPYETGSDTWTTLFYKGYESGPFPLSGPGVFYSSSHGGNPAPTLRIIMNTYDAWFNKVDINQIPVNKWFHLVIVLRKNALYVYINGNLATKKSFDGTLPYQNYESLILFPTTKTTDTAQFNNAAGTRPSHGIPAGENFLIAGATNGYISNMTYFSYAITYSEIQAMMARGPSSQFDSASMTAPPYLIDTWWTQAKN